MVQGPEAAVLAAATTEGFPSPRSMLLQYQTSMDRHGVPQRRASQPLSDSSSVEVSEQPQMVSQTVDDITETGSTARTSRQVLIKGLELRVQSDIGLLSCLLAMIQVMRLMQ
jgi:hypothetical protein